MSIDFEKMSKEDALNYCYKRERQFVFDGGRDGQEQFDCLIAIIKSGSISPSQLPEYGMEYEQDDDSLA